MADTKHGTIPKAQEPGASEFAPSLKTIANPQDAIAFGKAMSRSEGYISDMEIELERKWRGENPDTKHLTPIQESDNRFYRAKAAVEVAAEGNQKPTTHQLSELQIAAGQFATKLKAYIQAEQSSPGTLAAGEDLRMEAFYQVTKAIEHGAEASRKGDAAAVRPLDTPKGDASAVQVNKRS